MQKAHKKLTLTWKGNIVCAPDWAENDTMSSTNCYLKEVHKVTATNSEDGKDHSTKHNWEKEKEAQIKCWSKQVNRTAKPQCISWQTVQTARLSLQTYAMSVWHLEDSESNLSKKNQKWCHIMDHSAIEKNADEIKIASTLHGMSISLNLTDGKQFWEPVTSCHYKANDRQQLSALYQKLGIWNKKHSKKANVASLKMSKSKLQHFWFPNWHLERFKNVPFQNTSETTIFKCCNNWRASLFDKSCEKGSDKKNNFIANGH